MRVIAVAVVLLLWPNDRLARAEDAPLQTNARVRVTELAGRRLVGRLVAAGDTSVTVALRDKTVVVPHEALTKLEVSRRPSRKAWGAGIGLLVGAASGALIGYAEGRKGYAPPSCVPLLPCDDVGQDYDHRADDAISYALVFGALGAGIGGAAAPGDRWETVGVGRIGVRVLPARHGAGLTLALSF